MSNLEGFLIALGLILFLMICIGFWDTYKNQKRIRKWLIKGYHHHFSSQYNKLYHSPPDDSAIIIIYEGEYNPYRYDFPFQVINFRIKRDDLSNFLQDFDARQSYATKGTLYIIGEGFCGWLAIHAAQHLKEKNAERHTRVLAIKPETVRQYFETDDGFSRVNNNSGAVLENGNNLVDYDNWVVYSDDPHSIFGNVAPVVPINQNSDTQILNTFFNRFNHVAIVITTEEDNSLRSLVKPYVSQIVEFSFPFENLSDCLTKFKATYNELQNKTNLPIAVIGREIGGWFAIRAAQYICSDLYHPIVNVMAIDPSSSEDCTCQYRYNDKNGKNGFVLHIEQDYPLLAQNQTPYNQGQQITPVDQEHWHVYSDNATTQRCYKPVATVHNESDTMFQDFFAQVKE